MEHPAVLSLVDRLEEKGIKTFPSGTEIHGGGDTTGGGSKFAGDSGNKPGTTGSWTPGGTYTAPSTASERAGQSWEDSGFLAEGGLASMFTRRR